MRNLLFLASILSAAPANAEEPVTPNSSKQGTVLPLRYIIEDSAKVGTVKAGFICGPKGSIRWSDIRLPRDTDLELELSNIVSVNSGIVSNERFELQGRVTSFKIKLCVPGLGIGERTTKGAFSIAIEWTQRYPSNTKSPKSAVVVLDESIEGVDPRKDSAPLKRTILRSAEQFFLRTD